MCTVEHEQLSFQERIEQINIMNAADLIIDLHGMTLNAPFIKCFDKNINPAFFRQIYIRDNPIYRTVRETKTQAYFQKFFTQAQAEDLPGDNDAIIKIVDVNVYNAVKSIVSEELQLMDKKIIDGLSLHINTLIEQIHQKKLPKRPDNPEIFSEHPEEYKIAVTIKSRLENILQIDMPDSELAFLTMFLYAARSTKTMKSVGVLVVTHGDSSATSMADVANALLDINHAQGINMPLNEKIDVTFNKVLEAVKAIDMGKGVLMLVDMGSLTQFPDMITEKTGILTRFIDRVTTPMVIEATRKSLLPDVSLNTLYEEVISSSQYIGKKNHFEVVYDFESMKNCSTDYYKQIIIDAVDKILSFLDAKKVCNVLNVVLDNILNDLEKPIDNSLITKFHFHCSCMVERAIRKDSLPYKDLNSLMENHGDLFKVIKKHLTLVEETFSITIPNTEIAYIIEFISTHFDMWA
jgi:transcriptional regulatory protein LevR